MDPIPLKDSPTDTAGVGCHHHQLSPRANQSTHAGQGCERIGDVFDDVMERHGVERSRLQIIDRVISDVQASKFAADSGRLRIGLDAADLPTQLAHSRQKQAASTSDVEKSPVWHGGEPIEFAGAEIAQPWSHPKDPLGRGRGVPVSIAAKRPLRDAAETMIVDVSRVVREVRRVEASDVRGDRPRIQPGMLTCRTETMSPRTWCIEDAVL